jgi:hypothetical protein
MKLRKTLQIAAALVALAVSSIAAAADKDEFEQRAEKLRSGPERAPLENDTGFSKNLKCMDGLFRTFGVRNVTVIIDEIPDATKKINVGARDMFMSATSQMTRTTHAIRLVPMVESRIFSESKRERVISDADYVIQGSISQFDDSVLMKQRDGAVCLFHVCVGAAQSDGFSGLGLDLNMVETAGLSLVPGADVRNAVLIRKKGNGIDGDITIGKFGAQYNFTVVSHDGNGQALRTLVELGAIELFGRLLKLPYWSCLGANDRDPEVRNEIDDWWEEMAADPRDRGRLFAYLQIQMRAQGVYDGDVNGRVDQALLRAVRAYRFAMGQSEDLSLDSSFLHQYLAADHSEARKIAATKLAEITQREGPLPAPVAQNPPPPAASTVAANAPTPAGTPPAAGQAVAPQAAPATPPAVAHPASPAPMVAQTAPPAAGQAVAPQAAPATPPAVAHPASPAPMVAQTAPPAAQAVAPQVAAAAPPAVAGAASPAPTAAQASPPPGQPVAAAPAAAHEATAAVAHPVGAAPAPGAGSAHTDWPVQQAVYHPDASVPTIHMRASRPANNAGYRAGEPFFVGLVSPSDGYLYCYLIDDEQRVSQFYPAPTQPLVRVYGGTLKVVNSGSTLRARQEAVACFTSPKDLGRQPLDVASVTGGLEGLKTRFASAVSDTFAMGVLDVKTQ